MSRTSKIVIGTIVTAVMILPVVATAGRLNDGEKAHLIFMRSEEKLARDVYLTFAGTYPAMPVFGSIAAQSEQRHTDNMLEMLLKFNVNDPEPSTEPPEEPGTIPASAYDQIGVFESDVFGSGQFAEYFTEKYTVLTDLGAGGVLEALYVAAKIEELDMEDINYCNLKIYEVFGFDDEYPCGLSATAVRALENTLGNLLEGSKNHLCAFISQIGPMMQPGECYDAQVLEQSEVKAIVDKTCPEFVDYLCPVNEP